MVDGARARARAYERIREEIAAGRQCFVVCPLVEESEALQAQGRHGRVRALRTTEFADLSVELIHGQLPSKEKAAAMEAFARGEADVLVATSVIEVGHRRPERHGDADRGRRALRPVAAPPAARTRRPRRARLALHPVRRPAAAAPRAIANERDGFRLAEVDLELRGAGDVLGTRQHGLPEFRVARLPEDAELLTRARDVADSLSWRIHPSAPGARAAAGGGRRALRLGARPDPGVRVVAGTFNGRRLYAPRGGRTRPTADRVREAVFSMLGDLSGARVLDLYAGSGALGIEALSRGAAAAVFVERGPAAVAAIRRNLAATGAEGATVRRRDALRYLARPEGRFDVVFVDAPYDSAPRLAGALSARLPAALAEGARTVTESDKRMPLELSLPLLAERVYGDTRIAIHG